MTDVVETNQTPRLADPLFRALIERSSDVVALVGRDGRFHYLSPSVQRMLGYAPDELIGCDARALLPPEERADAARTFDAAIAHPAEPVTYEHRYRRRDGTYRWVASTVVNLLADPTVGCFVARLRDVTERKETEAALAAERDLLDAFMRLIPDALYAKDGAGRFLRVNAAAAAHYGCADPRAVVGQTDFDIFPEPLAQRLADDERQVLAEGRPRINQLVEETGGDGEARWMLSSKAPWRDAEGRTIGLVGSSREVSGLIRAQQAVRASEARFRSLIANATDMVVILDGDGAFRYASPAVRATLGWRPEELIGRNAFASIHPDDAPQVEAAFTAVLAAPNDRPPIGFRFRHADGSWRWLESVASNLLDDPAVGGIVVNTRDVSERMRAAEELRAAKEAAEAANRQKSAFLSAMSHELRTPLSAVIGYADLLLENASDPLSAGQTADVRQIAASAGRLLGLINDLLDLSRIEAGQLQLAPQPVALDAVVEAVVADVAPQAEAKGLALRVDVPHDVVVEADPVRLRQILLNLVGNAVKFTDRGGVTVRARPRRRTVAMSVADTGIGIAPEDLPHIFDEFRQVGPSAARRPGGSGLGLAITKRLVDLHAGHLQVQSALGVGSTFTVRLPVAAPLATAGD
ncbi:MAG: PAS domain S-box protein [Thermomicrobiales bacterium]|nr:PAS domain S-box protein [Thermomicrobiales bacterium]